MGKATRKIGKYLDGKGKGKVWHGNWMGKRKGRIGMSILKPEVMKKKTSLVSTVECYDTAQQWLL